MGKNNDKIKLARRYTIWKGLKVSGDVKELADMLNKSTVTISKAINNGEGSLAVLQGVNDFFLERAKVNKTVPAA